MQFLVLEFFDLGAQMLLGKAFLIPSIIHEGHIQLFHTFSEDLLDCLFLLHVTLVLVYNFRHLFLLAISTKY
jgi:hypothetical protein